MSRISNDISKPPLGVFLQDNAVNFLKRVKGYDPEIRAVLFLLVLSLVNIAASAIGVFLVGIYLLTRRDAAANIFRTGGNGLLFAFLALCVTVSAFNRNFVGIAACVFVFFLFVTVLYLAQNITALIFEDIVTIYLTYSIIAVIVAALEYLFGHNDSELRCSSTFANPLYFSFFITFAVLFCTYRIITVKMYRRIYIPVLMINAAGMILSGSRMPWVGMFIGLFLILLMCRKYKLIAVFTVFIAVLLLLFWLFPDFSFFAGMRLHGFDISYDGRKPYWDTALKGIFDKPLFGHGMIGMLDTTMKQDGDFISRFTHFGNLDSWFMNMKHHGWKMHSHNILLEMLFCFGIIGSLMLMIYCLKKGIDFFKNCGYTTKNPHFALFCGIVISICVNGLVDCEIVGLQTSVFTLIIFSVTGMYSGESEKNTLYKLEPGGINRE